MDREQKVKSKANAHRSVSEYSYLDTILTYPENITAPGVVLQGAEISRLSEYRRVSVLAECEPRAQSSQLTAIPSHTK